MQNLAAIVVLYNNTSEVIDNIKSYIDDVKVIYCIDNSDKETHLLDEMKKVVYIPQYKNIGLAKALNLGCNRAIEDGADSLITFDQDTFCEKNTVKKLKDRLEKDNDNVFVPNIKTIYRGNQAERIFSDECLMSEDDEVLDWAITSGTIMSTKTYINMQGFDDNLFIGQIDQDFCFRLKKNNKRILKLGDAYIYQELGNTTKVKIFSKTLHISNLSPFRYFYIFRNERYLRKKWGHEYKNYYVKLYKYIISIIFFESNKLNKLKSCMEGFKCGKNIFK